MKGQLEDTNTPKPAPRQVNSRTRLRECARTKAIGEVLIASPRIAGDCEEWPGRENWKGYGTIRVGGFVFMVHRLAWEAANDQRIPKGMLVCHHCDNPPCYNPEHLFLGTKRTNALDAVRKGRVVAPIHPGESHPMAKLTAAQVREIRELFATGKYSRAGLARLYSVSWTAVDELIRRRRWSSVA